MPQLLELAHAVAARAQQLPAPTLSITELLFDSRRVLTPANSLFFAIKTEKDDGHRYINELITKGVRSFVVTEDCARWNAAHDCNFIQVDDSIAALQQIAAYHRRQFNMPVIGITGSNGKTIVKEWLTQMLADDRAVVASPNSYNSQIGVPLSVWQMNRTHDIAIFEAGISQPGEMEKIAAIIQPTIGIFTNIGTAHAQFFADEKEKLEEKIKLFRSCPVVIYHQTNGLVAESMAQLPPHTKQLSWGESATAYYRITHKQTTDRQTIVTLAGSRYLIPFTDEASVENALHTVVLLLHLGFAPAAINRKLARLTPVERRMEVKEAVNQSVVINDTYSLDFNSLKVALHYVKSQIRYERKTVILSDFAQMGALETDSYLKINALLKECGITKCIGVGRELCRFAALFDVAEKHFFPDTAALLRAIPNLNFHNEVVLVKGARAFEFEKVVDALQLRTHRTILQVSLPALVHNLNYYRSLLAPTTKVVAMVKAMGYGLGDVELINELQYHHIDYLAVAYTDEGVNLRKKNIKLPIIVLGAEGESYAQMIHYQLQPEIFNFYSLDELEKALLYYSDIQDFKIHIKVDSGMHRLGFRREDIPALVARLRANPQLRVASVFSHLAAAEDPAEDDFTRAQIAYFQEVASALTESLGYPILQHIANTAGISRFPEAHFNMVRVGIGLYGFTAVAADQPHLQHVATLKTLLTHVQTVAAGDTAGYNRAFQSNQITKIGIIPIGYADGFPPELGCGVGKVWVRGQYAPIIGKICMDMALIDLTGIAAKEGDEVIVYGEENRVDSMARAIGKIPYHLLTAISKRVQRVYVME